MQLVDGFVDGEADGIAAFDIQSFFCAQDGAAGMLHGDLGDGDIRAAMRANNGQFHADLGDIGQVAIQFVDAGTRITVERFRYPDSITMNADVHNLPPGDCK